MTSETTAADGVATDRQCFSYDRLQDLTAAWTSGRGIVRRRRLVRGPCTKVLRGRSGDGEPDLVHVNDSVGGGDDGDVYVSGVGVGASACGVVGVVADCGWGGVVGELFL